MAHLTRSARVRRSGRRLVALAAAACAACSATPRPRQTPQELVRCQGYTYLPASADRGESLAFALEARLATYDALAPVVEAAGDDTAVRRWGRLFREIGAVCQCLQGAGHQPPERCAEF